MAWAVCLLLFALAGLCCCPAAARSESRSARARWWIARLSPILWLLLSLQAKTLLAHSKLSLHVHTVRSAHVVTIGFFTGTALGLLLLDDRWARILVWLAAAFGSTLLLGDVVCFRLCQDFLCIPLLSAAGGLDDSFRSVTAALHPGDLLFFADLPPALWALWSMRRPESDFPRLRRAAGAVAGLTWLALATVVLEFAHSSTILQARYQNRNVVEWNGLPVFHVYDLVYSLQPALWPAPEVDPEVIRARLARSAASVGKQFPHYGLEGGRNLLIMQLESFESFLLHRRVDGQPITPFLDGLASRSLYGQALDQTSQGASSDCEFVLLNSLHPPQRGPLCFNFSGTRFRALPKLLGEQGYDTWKAMPYFGDFWNARAMSGAYGMKTQFYQESFPLRSPQDKVGWSLSDSALFAQLVPLMASRPQPFVGYVTTTMMHHPFDELAPEQEKLRLPTDLANTMMGDYLQLARVRDMALAQLVADMQKAKLWDNTVVVLCGDHHSRLPDDELRRLGLPVEFPDRDKVPLLIHLPGDALAGELPAPLGQIDLAPTLVQLLGLGDSARAFLGRNLLARPASEVTSHGGFLPGGSNLTTEELQAQPDSELARQWREELDVSDLLIRQDRIADFSR
jgi:phosphoglycerol transferase MdoB-like AlkP superfamily enzyme